MQVAILSFNHPQLTSRCVQSALNLGLAESICLVHNGSLPKHIDQLKNEFPQIKHIVSAHNRGFSGGANLALTSAFTKCPWVLFITNDCELVQFQRPDVLPGLYAPLIYKRNTEQIDSLGGAIDTKTIQLRHLSLANNLRPRELFYVPGTAFWIHQEAFEKLGGFDENFGTYWEDVDLSLRAHELKISTGSVAEIWLRHKIGKTCHGDPHYTSYLYSRNQATVARRHLKNRSNVELQLAKKFSQRLVKNIRRADWKRTKLSLKAIRDTYLKLPTESNIEIRIK